MPSIEPLSPAVSSQAGDLRLGAVHAIPAVLREFGIAPARVLRNVGLDPAAFDDWERRIGFASLGRLLDDCVEATGCPHFGLLVGQHFDPAATLTLLGDVMRHSETVGAALRALVRFQHITDRGAVPMLLEPSPTRAIFAYSIYYHDTPAAAQIYDGGIAIGQGIMQMLCGPRWRADEVALARSAPADTAPYRRFFGCRVRFDAELSGLSFPARLLRQPVPGADAARYAALQQALRERSAAALGSFAEQVRRALPPMVYTGTAHIAQVSALFDLHERTLRRMLAAEGTTFHRLATEARFEVARQLLGETQLSLSDIAATLGYSADSAFSRAFRLWAGATPGGWRAAHVPAHRNASPSRLRA